MSRKIWIILLTAFLSACTSTFSDNSTDRAAICKELKRRIVFNAATSNNTTATQQRAELNRLNRSYNSQGC